MSILTRGRRAALGTISRALSGMASRAPQAMCGSPHTDLLDKLSIRGALHASILRDKRGISTSIVESLAGISIKMVTTVMVSGLLSALFVFWAVTTASADTSSGFQTSNLGFEEAVKASSVVVGSDADRVGLLKDTADGKCTVETWQSSERDAGITLHVDTKTVAGVCTPTTSLIAVGSGSAGLERLFGIKTPVFTYTNLGGREITFNASGTPALATGVQPADVKLADWNDVRPHKVTLKLETLNEDTGKDAKKAVLTGFTNVINVTAAADDLRYVPALSDDPIPGPLRITGVARSTTVGTSFAGAHEGLAVTFAGAVCPSGPTKVNVSYAQQGPSATPPVNTVVQDELTGSDTTVQLGSVPNGSTGAVDVSATCVDGGATETASLGYTQLMPQTVLTVKQNAAAEKHNLSWVKVSSLPTSFEVFESSPSGLTASGIGKMTALSTTATQAVASTYGLKSEYKVVATVDNQASAPVVGTITTPWPATSRARDLTGSITSINDRTLRWTNGAACPAGTSKQVRANVNVKWNRAASQIWANYETSAWITNLSSAYSTTAVDQGYPFGYDVGTKCVSPYSESTVVLAQQGVFPETEGEWMWNTFTTPAAPVYNAYTNHVKWERPAGSIYDICRNKGTSTCKYFPGKGDSIVLTYNTSCPAGSDLGATHVHSRSSITPTHFDQPFNIGDGWETGRTTRAAWYSDAYYSCNTPFNTGPISYHGGDQYVPIWGR